MADAIEQAAKQLGVDPDALRKMQRDKDRDELKSIMREVLEEILGDGDDTADDGKPDDKPAADSDDSGGTVTSLAKRLGLG